MRVNWKMQWWSAAGAMGLFFAPLVSAQPAITNDGSYTVFRTGTNEPVVSLELPLAFPDLGVTPTLRFEFGFGTDEPNALDTFFDSFSLTLQSSNQVTAIAFAADQSGVAWAPRTPGGLELSTNAMLIAPTAFHEFSSLPSLRFAYTVSMFLPAPLSSGSLDAFFDFFDNLNGIASMAYILGVQLDATGSLDTKARFYRLKSSIPTRIDSLQDTNSSVLLAYHFEPRILELQSADMANGPFTPVTNAALRTNEQTFVLPCPDTNKIFRIVSETNATIVGVRVSGMNLLVEFDFDSNFAPVEVQAAVSVAIPTNSSARFFERPDSRAEPTRRRLRVAKPGLVLPPPQSP